MLRDLVTIERGPATPTAVSPVASERPEPVHPDAELLEACAACHACEDSRPAPNPDLVCNTPECDRHEALHEAITERADVMVGDLAAMPAVTREGMQAKARAILLWDGGNALKGEPDDYSGDRLMASLLRDLLGGGRGVIRGFQLRERRHCLNCQCGLARVSKSAVRKVSLDEKEVLNIHNYDRTHGM